MNERPNPSVEVHGRSARLAILDVWRGLAIIGVVIFHFGWDLEYFGVAPAGMTTEVGWIVFARSLAASFMFLVGASLFLSHAEAIRWRAFMRRFLVIAGAAALITLATFLAMPETFIFFGILHAIALGSVLGLAFLRLPWFVTATAGFMFVLGRDVLASEFFNAPYWYWTGLSIRHPVSNDYVPLFPWFGVILLGIATAQLATRTGVLHKLACFGFTSAPWRAVVATGRHTLAIYLLHQPVLIALLYLFLRVF